ncbi:hypothetical protein HDC90_004892 [Pedobacter sp. AK013]|nr:hypothetical protein [Pedobacter sp. AK013]
MRLLRLAQFRPRNDGLNEIEITHNISLLPDIWLGDDERRSFDYAQDDKTGGKYNDDELIAIERTR